MKHQKAIQYFSKRIKEFGTGEFGFQYEDGDLMYTLFGIIKPFGNLSGAHLYIYRNGIEITTNADYEVIYRIKMELNY